MTTLNINIAAILLSRNAKENSPIDLSMLYLLLALVSFFLVVLLFVFLRRRVVQLFRLWYILLVHGQYSFEFLCFFKDNNLRSPINGCIKDEISQHLLVFFRRIKNSVDFSTETPIDYGDVPFMTTTKSLFKIKGKPDCMKVGIFGDTRFIVAGYNETLQGLKIKSFYFLVSGKFVMGEFMFADLHNVKPENLITTLSKKYLKNIPVANDVFYIMDAQGNQLNYEHNGFAISIKYLYCGDQQTNELLGRLASGENLVGNNQVSQGHDELLDRF